METVPAIVTVFGFIAVIYQLRQVEISTRVEVHDMLASHTREVLSIFKDYPNRRPYFYEGKQIERDDPEYNRLLIISEYWFDLFEHVVQKRTKMSPDLWNTWENYIKRLYYSSPILQTFIQEHQEMYTQKVLLLTLDSTAPKSASVSIKSAQRISKPNR